MPDLLVASRMKSGLPKPRLVHSALPIPQQQQQLCSRPSTRGSQARADPQVRMRLSLAIVCGAIVAVLPDMRAAVETQKSMFQPPPTLTCDLCFRPVTFWSMKCLKWFQLCKLNHYDATSLQENILMVRPLQRPKFYNLWKTNR